MNVDDELKQARLVISKLNTKLKLYGSVSPEKAVRDSLEFGGSMPLASLNLQSPVPKLKLDQIDANKDEILNKSVGMIPPIVSGTLILTIQKASILTCETFGLASLASLGDPYLTIKLEREEKEQIF